MTEAILQYLLCCLDRLDLRDLRLFERLNASPLGDCNETDLQPCSKLITGAIFSFLLWAISVLCLPRGAPSLLPRVLLLSVFSNTFDRDVAYRARLYRVASSCALKYVLVEIRIDLFNFSITTHFICVWTYTRQQRSAFSDSIQK